MKWPNVPDCFGWLALDRRGHWRMRDEFAQQNHLAGQVIQHAVLNDFIARNYACDELGRYFFQNGPQRVFITLDATPWIVRIFPDEVGSKFRTQCNNTIDPKQALSDEDGNIYIVGNISQTVYNIDGSGSSKSKFFKAESVSIALLHDHGLDYFSGLAKLHEEACSFGGSWIWQEKPLSLEPIHSKELATRFNFIANPQP